MSQRCALDALSRAWARLLWSFVFAMAQPSSSFSLDMTSAYLSAGMSLTLAP